ncbi:MAG: site-2 protease family protein [Treponema sp.]|nr:site-2 protease family protein [Treponema sp.]
MSWIYGLLCLIFLILFHEFGHFVAAKIFGVKVESFSIGMGPVLLHKKFGDTDFRLSLLPLGGYCGMKGEKDFQKAVESGLTEIVADKDSFYGVHPAKRALIGFAGPFFNFIFAVIGYAIINMIGYTYTTASNKIILPTEAESKYTYARDAGLLTGDKILSINGNKTEYWDDITQNIIIRPDEDIVIVVERDGKELTYNAHTGLDKSQGIGVLGIKADSQNLIKRDSPKYSFFPAFGHGFLDTINTIKITFKSLGVLFKGVEIKNTVSGIGRVTDMLGTSVSSGFKHDVKTGFIAMFDLMAIISVSLAVMNLLPIPVLDGGLILIAVIECIIRRKIKPKVQYYIQFIGIAFIALCLVLAIYGDISYFTNRGK